MATTILPHLTPREREELLHRIDFPGQPLPQPPGWPSAEDTQRALDIARRLAPFRGSCRDDSHAEAAADTYLTD